MVIDARWKPSTKSPSNRQASNEGESYALYLSFFAVIFGLGVPDLTPIEVTSVERSDDGFRSRDIGRGGYVASVAFLHECGISEHRVGIFVLFSKVEKYVDLVVSDTGSDLLNAALTSGEELLDLKAGGFRNAFSGHFGGADIMLCEHAAVSDTELNHEFSFSFG